MSEKINETVILSVPITDCSKHKLSKYIMSYLGYGGIYPYDVYYYGPLKKIFSKVIVYDQPKRMTEIGVAVNKEIIDIVRKEHPKYFIWVSTGYHEFLESTFDTIRKEGTIVVGIFFDDEYRFDVYTKWWIPHVDYCITNVIEAVPKYKELGARVIYAMHAMGIQLDRDRANIEEKYDVSFVGSKKFDREQYVNEIKNRNIPVHVFGIGWGEIVTLEKMINIYESSKINLNFSKTEGNKPGWKGRVFEVCLAGGFLLTEYIPRLEKYFEIGKEIVCFHNKEEMINKIKYYLTHEEERRAIAQAGWKRAISEYTPFQQISKAFCEIEEDLATKNKKSSYQPKKIKMTKQMRKDFSGYYSRWALAFSMENYKDLWKDALALSISYNPFNILAWCYCIMGFSPSFVRRIVFKCLSKIDAHYIKLYIIEDVNIIREMELLIGKTSSHPPLEMK